MNGGPTGAVGGRVWRAWALVGTVARVGAVALTAALLGAAWAEMIGGWVFTAACLCAGAQWTYSMRAASAGRRRLQQVHDRMPAAISAAVEESRQAFGLRRGHVTAQMYELDARQSGLPLAAATSGIGGGIVFIDPVLAGKAARAMPEGAAQRQVRCVVAHEVAHVFAHDVWVRATSSAVVLATFWCAVFGAAAAVGGFADGARVGVGAVVSVVAVMLVDRALSRGIEFRADARAAAVTRDPGGLADALEADFAGSLNWWGQLWSTHPGTDQRCRRLRAAQQRDRPALRR